MTFNRYVLFSHLVLNLPKKNVYFLIVLICISFKDSIKSLGLSVQCFVCVIIRICFRPDTNIATAENNSPLIRAIR